MIYIDIDLNIPDKDIHIVGRFCIRFCLEKSQWDSLISTDFHKGNMMAYSCHSFC
jgi:hypothetical protein